MGSKSNCPVELNVLVNGTYIPMEFHTDAAVLVFSQSNKIKYFPSAPLKLSHIILWTFTNEKLSVVGELKVELSYKDQVKTLTLYVVSTEVFGCDWLIKFN